MCLMDSICPNYWQWADAVFPRQQWELEGLGTITKKILILRPPPSLYILFTVLS